MASYLNLQGHEIYVFSPLDGELYRRSLSLGLNVIPIKWKKNNYYNPIFLIKLYFTVRKLKLDAIIFNSFIDIRDASFVCLFAGIKKRILRVGMPILPKRNIIYNLAFRFGLSRFVGISNEILNLFGNTNLINNKVCKFIPNGIDLDVFKFHNRNFQQINYSFGNCVRLTDQKGLFDFIDIAESILSKLPNSTFFLAGAGELENELKTYVKVKGLQDNFKFLGHIESVAEFYKDINFLIFTSRYEGTARTIIEAMSVGSIVFCYDTSSMSEMIMDGINGFKIEPFNVDKFIEKILLVCKSNPNYLQEIQKNAYKNVFESYNKKVNYEIWRDFILFD